MSIMLLLFLQSLYLLNLADARSPEGLTLLTTSSCICPGRQLVYECTVADPQIQFTVWKGSAFDCSSNSNEISLRHGDFEDTGHENGICNGGAILAGITSHNRGQFTSQLTVNTSLDMNGREVQCVVDDAGVHGRIVVNASTITLTTAPFQPPNDIRLIQVQPGKITFNWTSVDPHCDSLSYNIISTNCGQCPPTTSNTSITCTDIGMVTSGLGQVCTLSVQVVVCGNITGIQSSSTSVIMKAPRVQTIHIVPRYDHMTGGLLNVATSFDMLAPVTISEGFEDNVGSYNISYNLKDPSTGNACSQVATIPALACQDDGVCRHTFEVSSSFCNPSTNISVTVIATSMFGVGEESEPLTIGSRNQLFEADFTFDVEILRITCTFLDTTRINVRRSCTVMFGLERDLANCRNLTQSLKREQRNNNRIIVDLPISLAKSTSNDIVCLVVRAIDERRTAEVERMLTVFSGCDENQLTDGSELSDGVHCGLPLLTAGIRDGLVCYTGTGIGAIAIHHCFNDSVLVGGPGAHAVRTCLPDGSWNGTIPRCEHRTSTTFVDSQPLNKNSTIYTAVSMGIVIILIVGALIVMTVLFIRSRLTIRKMLREIKSKEKMQIYEEVNQSEIIDSMKNMAYEVPSPPQRRQT